MGQPDGKISGPGAEPEIERTRISESPYLSKGGTGSFVYFNFVLPNGGGSPFFRRLIRLIITIASGNAMHTPESRSESA